MLANQLIRTTKGTSFVGYGISVSFEYEPQNISDMVSASSDAAASSLNVMVGMAMVVFHSLTTFLQNNKAISCSSSGW